MNRPIIVTRRVDGRLYPPQWPHTPPEVTERLRGLEHHLRCVEHLTFKQVQAAMLERFGERRSIGQIHKDVTRYECPSCAVRPDPPPARPEVHPWR
jgi:hypothetical protein